MSESKHTPGPWHTTNRQPNIVVNEGGNKWIARAIIGTKRSPRFICDPDQAEANARLIASAPDLLHALHECQSVLAMLVAPDAIKQTTVIGTYAAAVAAESLARTALAKAEGR